MKRFLWFLFGLIVGVVCTLLFSVFIYGAVGGDGNKDFETVLFDKPGDVMPSNTYEVDCVLPDGTALAIDYRTMTTVLLWDKLPYYDHQDVKPGNNQVFRHVGTCRYDSGGIQKTIPIVQIMAK